MAGLNGLLPKPPKDILPMPMAAMAPMRMIQNGRFEGRLNANNKPVRMADPSVTVGCTAMPEATLASLISSLDASAVYVLLPRGEYDALRPAWGLPAQRR